MLFCISDHIIWFTLDTAVLHCSQMSWKSRRPDTVWCHQLNVCRSLSTHHLMARRDTPRASSISAGPDASDYSMTRWGWPRVRLRTEPFATLSTAGDHPSSVCFDACPSVFRLFTFYRTLLLSICVCAHITLCVWLTA